MRISWTYPVSGEDKGVCPYAPMDGFAKVVAIFAKVNPPVLFPAAPSQLKEPRPEEGSVKDHMCLDVSTTAELGA
jgi:hypothetical protein